MSTKPSIENLKKFTGQSSQLNPKLQAVLGNLDVQLENELARYRREKRVEARSPQPASARIARPEKQKNLELVVTPTPLEGSSTKSAEPFQTDRGDRQELEDAQWMAEETSATSQSNLLPFSSETALPQSLEAKLSSNQESSLARVQGNTEQPDEYLESSEQLLGSLDNSTVNNLPNKSRRRRRRSLKSILSPLTVGVTLLFVLAIGTLAHVFTGKFGDRKPIITGENSDSSATETPLPEVPRSPNLADKEFVPLDLDTLGTLSDDRPTPTPTPTVPAITAQANTDLQNSATTPPNPSQNYPSLENINSAILPQSVQNNPENSNATVSNNSNNSDANNPDANNSDAIDNSDSNNSDATDNSTKTLTAVTSETASNTQPVENSQTSAQPTVSPQSFPAFFYVLIDYNNEDSLFVSRQVVPDAYVREFPIGVKIQMGAFDDNASAQTMVKYLKEQGLAAQVYQP